MRFALIIFLFLIAAGLCSGAALPDDAALDKPVTLAIKGEALSDIMVMLSKQTGVRLQADKKIGDQKATIFVDDKPLREVMEGLSRTFGYFWATKKYSTGTIYEIWQDEKSVQDRLKQRQKGIDSAWQAALENIRFTAKVAAMTPTERETMKSELTLGPSKDSAQTKAHLQAFSEVDKLDLLGPCASIFASLSETYLKMVKPGVSVRYDMRTNEPEWIIPEPTHDVLAGIVKGYGGYSERFPFDPNALNVNFSVHLLQNKLLILGTVATGGSTDGSAFWSKAYDVSLANTVIGHYIAPIDLPKDGDTSLLGKKAAITAKDIRKETEGYPQEVRGGMLNRSDVLSLLHSKLGLQVISDHYSNWTTWPINEQSSALDILKSFEPTDPLSSTIPADWGWDGNLLYSRTRDILSADEIEVPNRLLRRWATVCAENGGLGLDEYADIYTLSPGQIFNLSIFAPYVGIAATIPRLTIPPLRLFGTLSAVQRQEALAGGTSADAFTPDQRKALLQVFFPSGKSFTFDSKVLVGIWTTEAPMSRIDKRQSAEAPERSPEPPLTVALRKSSKPAQSNSQASSWIQYDMVYTDADGSTHVHVQDFSIPGKPTATPPAGGR